MNIYLPVLRDIIVMAALQQYTGNISAMYDNDVRKTFGVTEKQMEKILEAYQFDINKLEMDLEDIVKSFVIQHRDILEDKLTQS